MANPLPVQAEASEEHIGAVGGATVVVEGLWVRPSDTTAYAAGDVVADVDETGSSVIPITGCARVAGGSGVIVGAVLTDSANQATKAQAEVWLFDETLGADSDNAPFTPTDAEINTLLGVISLVTPFVGEATAGAGGNCAYVATGLNIPFKCIGGTTIYAVIVVRNAYTPVSDEAFTLRLQIAQD